MHRLQGVGRCNKQECQHHSAATICQTLYIGKIGLTSDLFKDAGERKKQIGSEETRPSCFQLGCRNSENAL